MEKVHGRLPKGASTFQFRILRFPFLLSPVTLPARMKIVVFGTGYVGLVSGVCLAAKGHEVVCLDLRAEVVGKLNRGQPHIHEPGLPELLRDVISKNRFRAALSREDAFQDAALILIAVGTPSADGKIDLQQIAAAARQIGAVLKSAGRFVAVVVKSTVVPGTTDGLVRGLLEETSGKKPGQFGLGMNPEFLREGSAVADFMNPDRIVLGHEDEGTRRLLGELYLPWPCEKLEVNTRTAEMIKYANNCLLATQISAVNELANLCSEIGNVDVLQVMAGVHLDKRWNPLDAAGRRVNPAILTYLLPGCGFGGSCFPKDVQALRTLGRERGLPMSLLQAVLDVNGRQPSQIVSLLDKQLKPLAGRKILLLGLAFKPDTDDVRESASLAILRDLAARGCAVTAHDPAAGENARRELAGTPFLLVEDWKSAVGGADAVVVATQWPEYAELKTPALAGAMAGKVLLDARRMFRPGDFPNYLAIGRRMI
jgi:UDPglucose 6-dehydrogenase/GDP-mannose 6-dehydrogenase